MHTKGQYCKFQVVIKSVGNRKKINKNKEFLSKINFWQNRFYCFAVTQNIKVVETLNVH